MFKKTLPPKKSITTDFLFKPNALMNYNDTQ